MRFGTDDEDSSLARAGMLREGPRPPPFGYRARERHPEGTDGAVPSEVECKAVCACRPERRRRRGGMTGSSSASEAGRRKGEVAICAIVRRRPCIRRNRESSNIENQRNNWEGAAVHGTKVVQDQECLYNNTIRLVRHHAVPSHFRGSYTAIMEHSVRLFDSVPALMLFLRKGA